MVFILLIPRVLLGIGLRSLAFYYMLAIISVFLTTWAVWKHVPPGGRAFVELKYLEQIIHGKRYKTEDATVLASNEGRVGSMYEEHKGSAPNVWLLRTQKGAYFVQYQNRGGWGADDDDSICAIMSGEAMEKYRTLPEYEVEWAEAFPGEVLEDA